MCQIVSFFKIMKNVSLKVDKGMAGKKMQSGTCKMYR